MRKSETRPAAAWSIHTTRDAATASVHSDDANVQRFLAAAHADNTLRAYASDLRHFMNWGGMLPATPESIARYLAHFATRLSSATLTRRVTALGRAHEQRGLQSPTDSELVRATLHGIKRALGSAQRQVAPLLKQDIVRMVRGLSGHVGLRDRALLLVGFCGALRRSELIGLDVADVTFVEEGVLLRLRRSKTDQIGQGRVVAVPRASGRQCAVRALQAWLAAAQLTSGPVFRRVDRYGNVTSQRLSAQSVALIVKRLASAAGLDARQYAGHSLRAGFATHAARAGASAMSIRAQTGHKSDAMLQRYIRDAELFRDNPNRRIW
jgi:site-specific recombinase XerD